MPVCYHRSLSCAENQEKGLSKMMVVLEEKKQGQRVSEKPVSQKSARARYAVPTLRTYGSILHLTAGRAGSGVDSKSKRRRTR